MRSYNLIRELCRHHEVDLFAFNQPKLLGAYFKSVEEGLAAAREHLSRFLGDLHIEEMPVEQKRYGRPLLALRSLFSAHPYTINWLKSPQATEKLKELAASQPYDVIHYDTISLAPYHDCRDARPTVMDHHNVESHMMIRRAGNEKNPLKKLYFLQEGLRLKNYEQRTLKMFDTHITCSDDDRARLLKIDASLNVHTVPNGISLSAPPVRNPIKPARLLFIGGLDWYPNRDAVAFLLNEIWPLVIARTSSVELHIVGKNPPPTLKAAAAKLPKTFLHGFVDDIESIYNEATLYVCPIRDGGGTKLKILDAMAHAIPVLAHPIACEGIGVTADTNVIFAESATSFADRILELVTADAELTRIGKGGYDLVREKYDFEQIGNELAKLFSNTAKRQEVAAPSLLVHDQT